jgi:homocysteine S-methyltransferase
VPGVAVLRHGAAEAGAELDEVGVVDDAVAVVVEVRREPRLADGPSGSGALIPKGGIQVTYLEALAQFPVLLTDGAIETRIHYEMGIPLDPDMEVARLLDDEGGKAVLETIYRQYLEAGRRHDLPMQIGTPTFRASPERIRRAGLTEPAAVRRINGEAVRLHRRLRQECGAYANKVFIAGVIGPKGDAYRPADALGTDEARSYHTPQAWALAEAGVDLLFAPTFPAISEAAGVARAMTGTGLPCVVSFVITAQGTLLDGTPIHEAIARIDAASPPAFYAISCVHPSVCREALRQQGTGAALVRRRLLGIKANTSTRPPAELVRLGQLDTEEPERFVGELLAVGQEFGFKVLGGCCGTDQRHIACLAARLKAERSGFLAHGAMLVNDL